ncbi:MAG: glycosyltransferase, partial [Chthoniobacterales bacterium]|nr:glycosyltransferase [Chthoniobacterales bacterium]
MFSELPSLQGFQPKFYNGNVTRFYLPLLFDLVTLSKPQNIVVLGLSDAQFYFTLCQAARETGLATSVTIIRRGRGGESAREDETWQQTVARANEFYGELAQARAGLPVQIAEEFAAASVDLLVLDDCESGEMLRAELTAWLPKVSDNGFVALHGIDLNRAHDPPREAWDEIKHTRTAAEFHEGIGLGIAALRGSAADDSVLTAQLFGSPERQSELGRIYQLVAMRIDAAARAERLERENAVLQLRQVWLDTLLEDRWKAQDVMDHQAREITRLGALVADSTLDLVDLQQRFAALHEDRVAAQEVMNEQMTEVSSLRSRFAALEHDRVAAQEVMDEQMTEISSLRSRFAALEHDRVAAQEVMDRQARQIEELQQRFDELHRDRIKAQLIMDHQLDQLKQWVGKNEQLTTAYNALKAQLSEQKRTLKTAKNNCRKNGRCFRIATDAKPQRSIPEKIIRELQRIPANLTRARKQAPPAKSPPPPRALEPPPDRYPQWIAEHEPTASDIEEQRRAAATLRGPVLSLLVPTHNTPVQFLDELFGSIAAQTYGNFEICVADGGSDDRGTLEALKAWEEKEPRLGVAFLPENLGIAENTNRALAMANGEFVALVDHDDLLAPFALYDVAHEIGAWPAADVLYSDEDRLSEAGRRHSPFFKPEWSPELLYSCMYLGHLTAYRRALLEEIGGFRKEFDLSQDYDLALRATEKAREIRHIPHVLYHWREHAASGSTGGKPDARKTNLAALAEAMRRRGLATDVLEYPAANRVRMKLPQPPRVSLIIPTDSAARAQELLITIPSVTKYSPLEIIIVTNSRLAASLAPLTENKSGLRLLPYDKPFNFSDKCNEGAEAATGDRLIFYNDDVRPRDA